MSEKMCIECKHARPCGRCHEFGCFVHCNIDKMGDIDPYQLNTCDFFEEPCKKQNAKPTYEQLETENAKLRTELKAEKDNHLEFLTNISNALRGFNQATRENR